MSINIDRFHLSRIRITVTISQPNYSEPLCLCHSLEPLLEKRTNSVVCRSLILDEKLQIETMALVLLPFKFTKHTHVHTHIISTMFWD